MTAPQCAANETVRPAAEATLLALGNPLLGDDGLGMCVLERLAEAWILPASVEPVDGGVGGLALLPVVEDARRLVILDAIDADRAPGELVVLEGEAVPAFLDRTVSPHQVGIAHVLGLARLRGSLPESVLALGLQPDGLLRTGIGLSPPVEAGLPRLIEALVERLARWGCAPTAVLQADRPKAASSAAG